MKKLILLLLFFPMNLSAQYFEPFSKKDIILESIFVGLVCIDWAQTLEFSYNNKNLRETNVILGERPSKERINTLIPLGTVMHVFITYALPTKYREPWQMVSIILEVKAIDKNYKNGIRISYYF